MVRRNNQVKLIWSEEIRNNQIKLIWSEGQSDQTFQHSRRKKLAVLHSTFSKDCDISL